MIKLFGILDLLCALLLLLEAFQIQVCWFFLLLGAIYLMFKLLIFMFAFTFATLLDFLAIICLLLAISLSLPAWLLIIAAIAIGQKGIFSLF